MVTRDDEAVPRRESARPREGGKIGPVPWAVSISLLLVLAMAGANGYRDLEHGREREVALLNEISDTKERIAELTRGLEDIENNPRVLERLAREELGLVAEDDVVLILPESLWIEGEGARSVAPNTAKAPGPAHPDSKSGQTEP